jgi:hypothetical protein
MARRRIPSLAYCEYVSPNAGDSAQVWRARLLLIDTARRIYPTFLTSLDVAVFPFYCDLLAKGYDFEQVLWVPKDRSPELEPVCLR